MRGCRMGGLQLMKISKIREIIEGAQWTSLDLQGHTRQEFARRDVPSIIGSEIAALDALVIAPRFARDIERRSDVRANCQRRLYDWYLSKGIVLN